MLLQPANEPPVHSQRRLVRSDQNAVLVHGGFVDGSGCKPVYDLLTSDGYHVAVVQNPTLSLQGDAAATRMIIDVQHGPCVLVGHSWLIGVAVGWLLDGRGPSAVCRQPLE